MALRKKPKKVICKGCNTEFQTRIPHQKFCNQACGDKYENTKAKKYRENHRPVYKLDCSYCNKRFITHKMPTKYCSAKCRRNAKADREHFNGLRRTTIGLKENKCWVCKKVGIQHLHCHHLMGHKIAPEPLIGLCPGCHYLVELLATRNFLNDEQALEDLITVARFRRNLPDKHTVIKYEET